MPNRIIREDINASERIASLDWGAETFYRRLMLVVDDYGRYEANNRLLKSNCYPVHDTVRETDIIRWLAACEKVELLVFYIGVDTKRYLVIPRVKDRPRAQSSKYPDPPPELVTRYHLWTPANRCSHMRPYSDSSSYSNSSALDGESPPLPEAHIPTQQEFIDAFMNDGIPEDYLRNKFAWFDGNNNWLDKHGRPRKYAVLVRSWWVSDRTSWKTNAGKKGANSVDRNAGTANEGKASQYRGIG